MLGHEIRTLLATINHHSLTLVFVSAVLPVLSLTLFAAIDADVASTALLCQEGCCLADITALVVGFYGSQLVFGISERNWIIHYWHINAKL
jgi:hypothetical protein